MTVLHSELISAPQKDSRRLMVMLHGLGDSIEGYRWLPEVLDLPWLNYLLVNAPDEYYEGFSWFDYPGDVKPGILRSRKLLFEMLNELRANGFAPEQMTLGGFSQGSLMTVDAGLRYPHKLAGLVGISGWIFEVEQLLKEASPVARQQRLLLTHGEFDSLIPIAEVRQQTQRLKAAGFDILWREFPKDHTIYGEAEMAVVREFVRAGYSEK